MIPNLIDYFENIRAIVENNKDVRPVDYEHFVVAGCSHSVGVGVEQHQRYSSILQQQIGIPARNISVPGGCATVASVYLTRWLSTVGRPRFAVVQWPNVMRWPAWYNESMYIENANDHQTVFPALVRAGETNFWAEWLRSVLTTNILYQTAGIPIINIYLDSIPRDYRDLMLTNNITVYDNIDNAVWSLDSKGSDGKHHSAECHAHWASRILGIINETTTR